MTNDPEPDDVTKNMITRMTPTDVMVASGNWSSMTKSFSSSAAFCTP